MKWNADKMAAYDISEILITHQTGDKSEKLIQVLRYVGPWLAWQDWRKLEKLNKVIREWCHSEDAAISLFGLWQERTMSLCGAGTHMDILVHDAFNSPIAFSCLKLIPFTGFIQTHQFDYMTGNLTGKRPTLYRSLLELSDLEKQIVGNAFHTGISVRGNPLPIKGGETDRWLDICLSDLLKTNCILPYYHFNVAVPMGLKIVLSDYYNLKRSEEPEVWQVETAMAVGRAAALGLSGLIVFCYNRFIIAKIWESFVSALQEQKEGESVSPLEFLSLPHPRRDWWYKNLLRKRSRCVLASFRDQLLFGKLRNLKCLHLGLMNTEETIERFGLRKVLYACPNLQVLELGLSSDYEYILNTKLPNNVYSPYNCIDSPLLLI